MKLSYYINFILSLEQEKNLTAEQASGIDSFDDGILILDDIQDQSKTRDGKPCFYITHGVETAKIEAKRLERQAFHTIDNICKERELGLVIRWKAKFLLYQLSLKIKKGQKMDDYLEQTERIDSGLVVYYDEMIRLFTGGHIKCGFLLGYLFAGKNPDYKNRIAIIGEQMGIIRQIMDDLNDYQTEHHEPLGDLIHHKKRIPELLFFLNASDQEKSRLQSLLLSPQENALAICSLVLNNTVSDLIDKKIEMIKESILFKIKEVPGEYKGALTGYLNEVATKLKSNTVQE